MQLWGSRRGKYQPEPHLIRSKPRGGKGQVFEDINHFILLYLKNDEVFLYEVKLVLLFLFILIYLCTCIHRASTNSFIYCFYLQFMKLALFFNSVILLYIYLFRYNIQIYLGTREILTRKQYNSTSTTLEVLRCFVPTCNYTNVLYISNTYVNLDTRPCSSNKPY